MPSQTSSRPRGDVGGSFASRRGHTNQLSISDPSHHVTEAIGTLYGDEDDYAASDRPLSFLTSPYQDDSQKQHDDGRRRALLRSTSDKSSAATSSTSEPHPGIKKAQTVPARMMASPRNNSFEHGPASPMSPTLSLRDVQADSQFALTNIDNPNDIAQELSNLQALRRMSMDVGNNSDPDLLPFNGMSLMAMPSTAPTGGDDEGDPERLLWVPARVHPELAPMEFKSFLEKRVQSIKRKSGESFLSPDGIERSNSSALRRKKSTLSRQIDNSGGRGGSGYMDGSERLGRQRSLSGQPELSLDELVKDPTKAVQRLAQESRQDVGEDVSADDIPILPTGPGMGLRRSTRTTYRKGGSIRSGERLPFSKRVAAARQAQDDAPSPTPDAPRGHTLARVQTEPITENYSRPRSVRRQQKFSQDSHTGVNTMDGAGSDVSDVSSITSPTLIYEQLPVRRSSASGESRPHQVPQIVESPVTEEDMEEHTHPDRPFPQRSSSQKATQQMLAQHHNVPDEPPARSSRRPAPGRPLQNQAPPVIQPPAPKQQPIPAVQPAQQPAPAQNSLNDMTSQPSPLPGGSSTRTDSLTFIPTFTPEESKKPDRKGKKDKEDDGASVTSSKSTSSWRWFKGGNDDKEKKRKEEEAKKAKSKGDGNARLDVLQTSIESAVAKGRESLLLDRESIDNKLQEERKKESSRKSDTKKEKEGGIFSLVFGGGKKKTDKESGSGKKGHHLRPSEDPPYRPQKPDVDYHWSRFPLLEERAIYRMAHIKLANPRRSLLSQVLLSNFMYNYLAIVQAMHPQMQVPQSPQQKRLEEERRRKEQEQQEQQEQQYLAEQQRQQEQEGDSIEQYNYEYHRVCASVHPNVYAPDLTANTTTERGRLQRRQSARACRLCRRRPDIRVRTQR